MNFKDYGANQTMIDSTLSGFTPGEIFDDLIVTNAGFTFGCINHAREFSRKHNRNLFLIKNNRLNILSNIAYCQWSLEEIELGLPWKHLLNLIY